MATVNIAQTGGRQVHGSDYVSKSTKRAMDLEYVYIRTVQCANPQLIWDDSEIV